MERIVHKSLSHEEADRWDVEQHVVMTPEQRMRAARMLKDRAYPADAADVRAWCRCGVDGTHFSPDTRAFLKHLWQHRV